MKKIILVLLSAVCMTSFAGDRMAAVQSKELRAGNDAQHVQLSANKFQQKMLTPDFLAATTVSSAKNSAALTTKATVIARSAVLHAG